MLQIAPTENQTMSACKKCSRPLTGDEIGLTKKLINRGATEFLCLKCLSREFGVEEKRLREKIEEFRKSVCSLYLSK